MQAANPKNKYEYLTKKGIQKWRNVSLYMLLPEMNIDIPEDRLNTLQRLLRIEILENQQNTQ